MRHGGVFIFEINLAWTDSNSLSESWFIEIRAKALLIINTTRQIAVTGPERNLLQCHRSECGNEVLPSRVRALQCDRDVRMQR